MPIDVEKGKTIKGKIYSLEDLQQLQAEKDALHLDADHDDDDHGERPK